MAQVHILATNSSETVSNDNSMSIKEFLQIEKSCEMHKDSDEEIKMILKEIDKLSGEQKGNKIIAEDIEDVDLILKRAEDISQETDNLLRKATLIVAKSDNLSASLNDVPSSIPQIKVTEPNDNEIPKTSEKHVSLNSKAELAKKHNTKENTNETRRKMKVRPFSAGNIDSKKRDVTKNMTRLVNTNSPKKTSCKHDALIEELKDTNERAKALEMLNVQLTDDNTLLRKKLDQTNEDKHLADLKLAECEKFINRLGKEYDNRNRELNAVRENESKIMADLTKERNERKNLTIRHEKDEHVIQDLQRQVKEMELILKRKHPDSVSALIVASKSSTVEDNKKKLLEERILRLEQELRDKEHHFQSVLQTLQEKFGDMKQKYESHIIDVERKLMDDRKINADLKIKLNKSNLTDAAIQTGTRAQRTLGTQTVTKTERASSAVSRLSQNSAFILNKLKEDSYLVATIKGLQAELTVKQRTIAKINRETEELRKNLRNLQKEKEVLLTLNPQKKVVYKHNKSAENIIAKMNTEMEVELCELRQQKEVSMQERNSLLDSLKCTNEEFILLKKKRIQDLHTLQLAHEKELMQMNMQLYPLQEEIKLLNRTVDILKERVRVADEKLMKYQASINAEVKDALAGGDTHANTRLNTKRDSR